MLEAKAGLRPRRRSGLGGAIYEQWESELAHADAALPKDSDIHHCLIITDGNDPNRGVLNEEGDVHSDLDVAATVDGDVPADVNGGDGGGPAVSVDGGNDGAPVA